MVAARKMVCQAGVLIPLEDFPKPKESSWQQRDAKQSHVDTYNEIEGYTWSRRNVEKYIC